MKITKITSYGQILCTFNQPIKTYDYIELKYYTQSLYLMLYDDGRINNTMLKSYNVTKVTD